MKRKIILLSTCLVTLIGVLIYDIFKEEKLYLDVEDDLFTLTVDGVVVDEIPTSGNYTGKYKLISYTCDNNSVLEWNSSTRQIITTLIGEDEYCTLNFKEIIFDDKSIEYSGVPVEVLLYPGTYKLEVWGAQGGNYSSGTEGGYGGYSVGYYTVNSNTRIYVVVGGQGSNSSTSGGYNGGGNSYDTGYGCSGGGATHIATRTGILSSLSSYKSSILIVAGGGGGMSYSSYTGLYYSGGSGGGISGNSGGISAGSGSGNGGTQTGGGASISGGTAGSFGQGGTNSSYGTGSGGGGYYGGSGGGTNRVLLDRRRGSGGGGSGYIGNSSLTDKYMYCYCCTTSSDTSTKTYSTASVSSTATSNYAKRGNGYAKITFVE